jgi:multidrug resistance protein
MENKRSPLGLIFLTVLIDMIGFGIVIPVLPIYAESSTFAATPAQLGWLLAIYSLLQLTFAPLFGKLSDRIGRKPVLTFSILGTAIGFFVTGSAQSFWILFLGRVIDGISGGNISTAQACIADVTTPEQRSRNMALIGVAFGLGFILGPVIGGVLSHHISPAAPFYFAGVLALINCALVALRLPETLTPERRVKAHERAGVMEVFSGGRAPFIWALLASYLTSITGFSVMTALFALFCKYRFGFSNDAIGYTLAYIGFLGMIIQGGLLRRLLRRPIEKQLAVTGAAILAISMALLPLTASIGALLLVCAGISVGNAFVTPTLNGLASKFTDARSQGRVLGLMQSAGSLGRVLGPLLAYRLLVLDQNGPVLHYARTALWAGSAILLVSLCFTFFISPTPVQEPIAEPVQA